MPWGLTRFHHSGQSHFVTFCCYHRRWFTTDASRRVFESAFVGMTRCFGFASVKNFFARVGEKSRFLESVKEAGLGRFFVDVGLWAEEILAELFELCGCLLDLLGAGIA